MKPNELARIIKSRLDEFYQRRIQNMTTLSLKEVLKRKNPYLLKAIGVQNVYELVDELLRAHTTSSDEGIFGDVFFEPIALAVSQGKKSSAEGVDLERETDQTYQAISVKSGPNIFNSSQSQRMNDEFAELHRRLRNHLKSLGKQFDPILGCGYGRRNSQATRRRGYRILAGQSFWEELTGDPDFYLKVARLMKNYPKKHRENYQQEWDKAVNLFARELLNDFADEDGLIDWDRLVRFNSGKQ